MERQKSERTRNQEIKYDYVQSDEFDDKECDAVIDPDILAALEDSDYDFDDLDNQLEDDFVIRAMGYERSSATGRKKGLLDEKFETLYEKEYEGDMEIGPLDIEPIEGYADINKDERIMKLAGTANDVDIKDVKKLIPEKYFYDDDEEDSPVIVEVETGGKHASNRMDCESVLSTCSNLYNHPRVITEPKLTQGKVRVNPKTGVPITSSGLTEAGLKRLDRNEGEGDTKSLVSTISHLSVRSKDETPEERKLRKSQVKELRRERRQEKKANMAAFKEEKQRQQKESINIKQNLSCVRLH